MTPVSDFETIDFFLDRASLIEDPCPYFAALRDTNPGWREADRSPGPRQR